MAGDHLQRLSEESVAVEKGVLLEDTRSEELTLCHACELRKKRWFRYSVAILEGRLSFYGHDFLKPQPIEGADVYLLRMILHDWPDKYAIQILRNIVPAMRPGARVILNESCVPEPGSVSVQREKRVRDYDVVMGCLFNAKERTETEWIELFGKADPRFQPVNVKRISGSMLSIIESSWMH